MSFTIVFSGALHALHSKPLSFTFFISGSQGIHINSQFTVILKTKKNMYNYINPTFQILKFIQDFSATINTTGTEDLHNQNQTVWCPTFLVILEQILTCN